MSVKEAFERVKKDINELREVQKSSTDTMSTLLDSRLSTFSKDTSDRLNVMETKLDIFEECMNTISTVTELNKKFVELEKDIDTNNKLVNQELKKLEQMPGNEIHMQKNQDRLAKDVDILTSKLQELDNASIDIDDMEHSFIGREEVGDAIKTCNKTTSSVRKLDKQLGKVRMRMDDFEEDKHIFAKAKKLEQLQDDLIDLKEQMVLRNHLEAQSSRIDKLETTVENRMRKIETHQKALESYVSEVIKLKKTFVTKEQFKLQKKEIRLLVQGLKDIQKIKDKIKKS